MIRLSNLFRSVICFSRHFCVAFCHLVTDSRTPSSCSMSGGHLGPRLRQRVRMHERRRVRPADGQLHVRARLARRHVPDAVRAALEAGKKYIDSQNVSAS